MNNHMMEFSLDVFISLIENAKLLNTNFVMVYPSSKHFLIGFVGDEYDNRECRVGAIRVFHPSSSNIQSINMLRQNIAIPFLVMTKDLKAVYSKLIPGQSVIRMNFVISPWSIPCVTSFRVFTSIVDPSYTEIGTYRIYGMDKIYNDTISICDCINNFINVTERPSILNMGGSKEGAVCIPIHENPIYVTPSILGLNKGDTVDIGVNQIGHIKGVSIIVHKKKGITLQTMYPYI